MNPLLAPAVQRKSLCNVRTAFKLMQNNLDPLLQGALQYMTEPSDFHLCLRLCAPHCRSRCPVLQASAAAGTLDAAQPAEPSHVEPVPEKALITRDQMRTADRIIVNVLQKVTCSPAAISALHAVDLFLSDNLSGKLMPPSLLAAIVQLRSDRSCLLCSTPCKGRQARALVGNTRCKLMSSNQGHHLSAVRQRSEREACICWCASTEIHPGGLLTEHSVASIGCNTCN